MQTLSHVSHEHHEVLRGYVRRLYALAECLCPDCLDTAGCMAELAELREVERDLREVLVPHMNAVEAAVYPSLERIMGDREASAPMRLEHEEIRRLIERIGGIVDRDVAVDRMTVLALRRLMLRLHLLLKAHLDEEDLYLPILEDRLTPEAEAALARALDHLAAARL